MIASLPTVLAMGVSPPRVDVTFEPNQRSDLTVTLINNNDGPVDVDVRVEGVLKNSVAVKQPIRIPARGTASVPLAFVAPAELATPGFHTTFVFFAERAPDDTGGTFAVRTEVGYRIILWKPYPGQYAELTAGAPSVPQGQNTQLKLLVNNLGAEAITSGRATVRIVSAAGELQDVFTFDGMEIAGSSNKDFTKLIPSSGYSPGKYQLQAKLEYNNLIAESNGSFAVGTQDVDIVALEGPLYLDKPVNRYTVHVESLWNQRLDNVYSTVVLGATPSTTPSIAIDPFQPGAMTNFWETDRSILPGQALATVTVYFPGGSKTALLPIAVFNETPKPPTYEAPAGADSVVELSAADLIVGIIAIILVASVILFAISRYHRRKDEGGGPGSDTETTKSASPAPNAVIPDSPRAPPQPSPQSTRK